MKYFSFLLLFFTLLSICLSEENDVNNSKNDNSTVIENKNSEEKKLEINHKLIEYLDSLKNLTEISKDELKEIFLKIYDLIINDPIQSKNETKIEIISNFTDEVFKLLADEEKKVIIVENIIGKFNISTITNFITRFFNALKIEEIIASFLKALLKMLGDMLLKIFNNTDL